MPRCLHLLAPGGWMPCWSQCITGQEPTMLLATLSAQMPALSQPQRMLMNNLGYLSRTSGQMGSFSAH
jgi:hypothetical protein